MNTSVHYYKGSELYCVRTWSAGEDNGKINSRKLGQSIWMTQEDMEALLKQIAFATEKRMEQQNENPMESTRICPKKGNGRGKDHLVMPVLWR